MHSLRDMTKLPLPHMKPRTTPYARQVLRHIQRSIGPDSMVFHDALPSGMPFDIHIIAPQAGAPTPDRPFGSHFFTLVTSGLSAVPRASAPGGDPAYVELMISLPRTWPAFNADGTLDLHVMEDERFAWPLHCLKRLWRSESVAGTALAPYASVPNTTPASPEVRGTSLAHLLLAPSALHPQSRALMVHDDIKIQFLALWPLHAEEQAFVQSHGAASLLGQFNREGITDLVNPFRKVSLSLAKHGN